MKMAIMRVGMVMFMQMIMEMIMVMIFVFMMDIERLNVKFINDFIRTFTG